jgi:hypothetical protein
VTSSPPLIRPAIVADLHPHPCAALPSPVSALRVACTALPGGGVRLAYALEGRIAALHVPTADEPDAWPLWQHTCFEAFVSVPGEERYREYNFSPAGLWAGIAFQRYREIERELAQDAPPTLQTEQHADALRLTADLPPALLPSVSLPRASTGSVLRLGLSAVVERIDGRIEYWALAHPVAERPDFHHPDGWTLRLGAREISP